MTTFAHRSSKLLTALLLVASLAPAPARAALERVGPNDPKNFLPTWYQDTTGLTMEFCTPRTQAELDGGYCLLLPVDVPTGLAPEVFPGNFSGEHFYWASDVVGTWSYTPPPGGAFPPTTTGKVVFVQAIEAAFLGAIAPGTGGVFGRVRIRVLDLPFTGTYKFYTPWGIKLIPGVAGGRIFDTEDIGINCAPFVYDCALQTSIGPFLVPSNTPGGAELPPVAGPTPGTFFLSDPARIGAVTGSPIPTDYTLSDGTKVNPNVFAIEAPNGVLMFLSHDFSTVGRVFTQVIPSRLAVDRTSYSRDAGSIAADVYATGEPTLQPRLPATPLAAVVQPQLSFFPEPCGGEVSQIGELLPPFTAPVGATAQPMSRSGNLYWGQTGLGTLTDFCVADTNARNALGQVVPAYLPAPLSDQVFVTEALYDPSNGGSLSVLAASSDQLDPPPLALGAFGDLASAVPFVDGLAYVAPLAAPPAKVRVLSAEKGTAELQVVVGSRVASGVTLTADMPSPQTPGIAVVFTAQGQGATHYEYRFLMDGGSGFQVVRDWSPTPTWIMNGATPEGHYLVKVEVWAGLTPSGPDAESVVVPFDRRRPPATGVTITPSRPSPAPRFLLPVPTSFLAEGSGSTGGYQYQFSLRSNGGPFLLVQNYGVGSSWTLPASTPPGIYSVSVSVRTSALVSTDVSATVDYEIVPPPAATGVALTSNVPSPQEPGIPVSFSATAAGPSEIPPTGYEYRFWLSSDRGATFSVVQDYGPSSSWSLPVSLLDGSYSVAVEVRTSSLVPRDAVAYLPFILATPPDPATGVTLQASLSSPQVPGTPVQFSATGQGSAGYSYRFWLSTNNGATFTIVKDYSPASTWDLPASLLDGSYLVAVEVRTSSLVSKDAVAYLPFKLITPSVPATAVTLESDLASPQTAGTPVHFSATGQGSSFYSYRFWLSSDAGATFTIVQDYSPASAWDLPLSLLSGSYFIAVEVRTSTLVTRDAVAYLPFQLQ